MKKRKNVKTFLKNLNQSEQDESINYINELTQAFGGEDLTLSAAFTSRIYNYGRGYGAGAYGRDYGDSSMTDRIYNYGSAYPFSDSTRGYLPGRGY